MFLRRMLTSIPRLILRGQAAHLAFSSVVRSDGLVLLMPSFFKRRNITGANVMLPSLSASMTVTKAHMVEVQRWSSACRICMQHGNPPHLQRQTTSTLVLHKAKLQICVRPKSNWYDAQMQPEADTAKGQRRKQYVGLSHTHQKRRCAAWT